MSKDFKKGIKFAAECADAYNSSSTHRYRLGDCIMAKLNVLPKGKRVRLNKQRVVVSKRLVY